MALFQYYKSCQIDRNCLATIVLAIYRPQFSLQTHLCIELEIQLIKHIIDSLNLQIVACGCPGGKRGNADASTTLNAFTPITLAFESTTASGSFDLPILPALVSTQDTMATWASNAYKYKKHDTLDFRYSLNSPKFAHHSARLILAQSPHLVESV